MSVREIADDDWTYQYLDSFYYATVTMLTIGYGDIVPRSIAYF
jgi:hypothetical protein